MYALQTETKNAVEATCTVAGYSGDIYCKVCGEKIANGRTVPALSHTGGTATCHSKAVCTRCGVEYGGYEPGDINGDGETDNKDLTRLFQYLSDWGVEVNELALDVNGDGSVDNKDLTRLFQYLSDWGVEIF